MDKEKDVFHTFNSLFVLRQFSYSILGYMNLFFSALPALMILYFYNFTGLHKGKNIFFGYSFLASAFILFWQCLSAPFSISFAFSRNGFWKGC